MFDGPTARTALRCGVVMGLMFLGTLRASIGDGLDSQELVDLASNTLGAGAAYLGIGAVTPAEPYVGVGKPDRIEVPSPPADPVPPEEV